MTGVLVHALGNEKCFTPQKMADVFVAIFEAIRAIVTEGVVRRRLENLAIRIAGPAKKRI